MKEIRNDRGELLLTEASSSERERLSEHKHVYDVADPGAWSVANPLYAATDMGFPCLVRFHAACAVVNNPDEFRVYIEVIEGMYEWHHETLADDARAEVDREHAIARRAVSKILDSIRASLEGSEEDYDRLTYDIRCDDEDLALSVFQKPRKSDAE